MADMSWLTSGLLGQALSAYKQRGTNVDAQTDAAVAPAAASQPTQPAPAVEAPNGRMIAGQALMAGANAGPRPAMSPQQQAQLVELLRKRMAAQGQQPGMPQPGQPPMPPMQAPIMQQAQPVSGMAP
jgi:hypothetical protein